jgi:hypothetical protein
MSLKGGMNKPRNEDDLPEALEVLSLTASLCQFRAAVNR